LYTLVGYAGCVMQCEGAVHQLLYSPGIYLQVAEVLEGYKHMLTSKL